MNYLNYVFEIIALAFGLYYLSRRNQSNIRFFVYFLGFTLLVEVIALYPLWVREGEVLYFLKDTKFERNFVLYNVYILVSNFFYIWIYGNILQRVTSKHILKFWKWVSILAMGLSCFLFYGKLFTTTNSGIVIWTAISVFLSTALYFYELVQSETLLKFYKAPLFYISLGLFVFWLIIPPVTIYMPYYLEIYPEYVKFQQYSLIILNLFLYGSYSIAFIYASKSGK